MNDLEQSEAPEQHRLIGEDTPTWLTIGFSLIGALLAAAAAWLWMSEQTWFQAQQTQRPVVVSVTQPAAINLSTKPTSEPAETPRVMAEVKEDQIVQSEPASPANNLNEELISPPPINDPDNELVSLSSDSDNESVSSLNDHADTLAEPSDVQDSVDSAADEPTAPTSTQSLAEPKDCPPTVTILFKQNSVQPEISADIQIHLKQLREWVNDQPKVKLSIEGHADSKGSERGNLLISYKRVKEVAALLNKAGVPKEQMIIVAFGEHSPIEGIPADAKDNRRVLLQVKGIENCQKASTDRERQ